MLTGSNAGLCVAAVAEKLDEAMSRVDYCKGHVKIPLTDQEVEEKCRQPGCAAHGRGGHRTMRFLLSKRKQLARASCGEQALCGQSRPSRRSCSPLSAPLSTTDGEAWL